MGGRKAVKWIAEQAIAIADFRDKIYGDPTPTFSGTSAFVKKQEFIQALRFLVFSHFAHQPLCIYSIRMVFKDFDLKC
jgi:hypothetical protein